MTSHVIIEVKPHYIKKKRVIEKSKVIKIKVTKGNIKLIKVIKVKKNLFYKDIWHGHQDLLENHKSLLQWIYGLQ